MVLNINERRQSFQGKYDANIFFVFFFKGKKKTLSLRQIESQESAAGLTEADGTGQMWGHDYTKYSEMTKMQNSGYNVKYGI